MDSIGNILSQFSVLRTVVAGRLLLVFLLFALVGFAGGPIYGRSGFRYVFYVGVALLFAVLFFRLGRLLFLDAGVVITDRGLLDRTSALRFIDWSEIRGATVRRYFGTDLVELEIMDEPKLIARLPLLDRYLWRNYIRNHGGRFNIKAGFLEGGATELIREIQEHLAASK